MRVIFFGTPRFAVPSLDALVQSDFEVVLVVTQPDRTGGRGRKMLPPPVKEYAVSRGIVLEQPLTVRAPSFEDALRRMHPHVIVVVAYGKILPSQILALPSLGCINVHGSLLPLYRGAAPIQWAIINGETRTGITTMLMDEGLDTGDILLQEETVITESDTTESLMERLSHIGASLLVQTIEGLEKGSVTGTPQQGEASYAPQLTKEDGLVDWSATALDVTNRIRGTYPWPGAYSFLNGERVGILAVTRDPSDCTGPPGTIVGISGGTLRVCTGRGTVSILEVKPEGKKKMTVEAFLRGRTVREGTSFGSA